MLEIQYNHCIDIPLRPTYSIEAMVTISLRPYAHLLLAILSFCLRVCMCFGLISSLVIIICKKRYFVAFACNVSFANVTYQFNSALIFLPLGTIVTYILFVNNVKWSSEHYQDNANVREHHLDSQTGLIYTQYILLCILIIVCN